MSATEPDQPDESRQAATEVDHLGRPREFIEVDSEQARQHWDQRLWRPTGDRDNVES